jgi:RNA polymerase sigma factor (TIGR02999 family)
VTSFLAGGDAGSGVTRVFERSYEELKSIAVGLMESEKAQHTLQPTALVHEIWIRLRDHLADVRDEQHFFALAARAMRHVLADHARMQRAKKRGGRNARITLGEGTIHAAESEVDLVALHDCLQRLTDEHERAARVFELRAFGALPISAVAELLEVAEITVRRDWDFARLWIQREFKGR